MPGSSRQDEEVAHLVNQVLCIIPARGGSKGIPGKNIRLVGGKPLLAHSIEQALGTRGMGRVFVSTDDEAIAGVAQEYGAEVIVRPSEISGDTATSESALLHALDQLQVREGFTPDLVVFLQATSPVREPDDIQRAIETLEREQADSLFSACPAHGFVWRVQAGGVESFTYDYRRRPRRQEAPEDLVENGSIYVFKPWVLREFKNRLGGKIAVYRMSVLNSFQVDDPGDLQLMELLLAHRAKIQVAPSDIGKVRLLVFDFDGVMTDNRVLVMEDGREGVLCNRGDGVGISSLRAAGVEVLVLSKERNSVVSARCGKLGIECIQGCDEKLAILKRAATERGLQASNVAYVGNDINDLECMNWAGLPIAVADAVPLVRRHAKWITLAPGGKGAVREVCDLLTQTGLAHVSGT
jgi:N-acylneuraminate cytidylyltransferase